MLSFRVMKGVRSRIESALTALGQFTRATHGATAVTLSLAMPVVISAGAFAVDYSSVTSTSSRLQGVIDSAALSVAREMTISPMTATRAQDLAQRHVAANIPANTPYAITVTATLIENNLAVEVRGTQQPYTPFGLLERFANVQTVSAHAVARVTASQSTSKLCMLSLGEKINGGIYLHNGSKITAPGCVVQSNSTSKNAVIINQNSVIKTQLICARGGVKNQSSTVDGSIVQDCPSMNDPLASKAEPTPSLVCAGTKLNYKTGNITLSPGTYCEGLTIDKTAKVTFNPGVYHFKDGPLIVKKDAEITGNGVTFMFRGKDAYFRFLDNSMINITAPASGATAGMLLWESTQFIPGLSAWWNGGCAGTLSDDDDINGTICDPTGSLLTKGKKTNENHINSNRARTLTGTIYLKRSLLLIDSTLPVADLSPYTLLVANKVDLFDGPNLTLNSDYSKTTVPIPPGMTAFGGSQLRLGY
ncbi:MAG TPA: pilus assembly protein [Rhabdaerophilum sp.]|nr:pilus assembly protein [Rhabdaerophilum sp.]